MIRFCFVFNFLLLFLYTGYSQWVSQNPYPYSGNYNDVAFSNSLEGWIVGAEGAIVRTMDGGSNWEVESWDPDIGYSSIEFIDSSKGFISAYNYKTGNSYLMRTIDGGLNWFTDSATFYYTPADIFFLNENIGYIGTSGGAVYKTTDSGQSWDSVGYDGSGFVAAIDRIFFVDEEYGWNIKFQQDIISRTTDGGATWEPFMLGITGIVKSVFFHDKDNGFAVGSGYQGNEWKSAVFTTSDGGQSWEVKFHNHSSSFLDIVFKTPERGWLVGGKAMIKHTNNGGISWNEQYYLPDFFGALCNLKMIHITPSGDLVAVGEPGLIACCSNDKDWEVNDLLTDHGIVSMFFIDEQTGWFGDTDYQIFSYNTQDKSWEKIFYNQYRKANDIYFVDENTGWYASNHNRIYRTNNGGINWLLQTQATSYLDNLCCIDFVSQDTGWATGNRKILHTTDGGANWDYTGYEAPFNILSIDFTDSKHGWAVGGQGGILHTTNWGWGWEEQVSPTLAHLKCVCFVDHYNGWICGEFGKILHTDDGGQTWVKQNSKTNNNLSCIMFADKMNGWAAGENGVIRHTVDGGENWYPEASLTDSRLDVIFASDPQHCWAGGELGTLLYADYTNWTGISQTEEPVGAMINVYPNPFRNYFEVDLFGLINNEIQVSLSDMNGRRVKSLDKFVNNGSGLIINATTVIPGIYILEIEGKDFQQRIKVIKLE